MVCLGVERLVRNACKDWVGKVQERVWEQAREEVAVGGRHALAPWVGGWRGGCLRRPALLLQHQDDRGRWRGGVGPEQTRS